MKTITKKCLNCPKEFEAELRYVKRGHGKFCSLKCSRAYQVKTKPAPEPNFECAFCGKAFYRRASHAAKSKSKLYFCCRQHKDAAQRLGGIKEIQPDHYGDGGSVYRDLAFRTYLPECDKCGYDKHKILLQVHHIDHDRSNNDVSNLQILCVLCHMEHHLGLE